MLQRKQKKQVDLATAAYFVIQYYKYSINIHFERLFGVSAQSTVLSTVGFPPLPERLIGTYI